MRKHRVVARMATWLAFTLSVATLALLSNPPKASAALVSQLTSPQGVMRIGGDALISVYTKNGNLANNETISVGIYDFTQPYYAAGNTNGYSNFYDASTATHPTSFASTQTPSLVTGTNSGSVAKRFDFKVPAPSVLGNYFGIACSTDSSVTLKYFDGTSGYSTNDRGLRNFANGGIVTDSSTSSVYLASSGIYSQSLAYAQCQVFPIIVASTPVEGIWGVHTITSYPKSGTGSSTATANLKFYDRYGNQTFLNSTDNLLLNLTGVGTFSTKYAGYTGSTVSETLPGNVHDGDGSVSISINSNNLRGVANISGGFVLASTGIGTMIDPLRFEAIAPSNNAHPIKMLGQPYVGAASGSDGKFYTWGNYNGPNETKPTLSNFPSDTDQISGRYVIQIAGSSSQYFVLADDGSMFLASPGQVLIPDYISGLGGASIKSITQDGKVLIDSTGGLWSISSNNHATKFDLTSINSPPVLKAIHLSSTNVTIFLASDGFVYSVGSGDSNGQGPAGTGLLSKVLLPSGKTVTDISGLYDFAAANLSDGTTWTWGNNSQGQQGKSSTEIPTTSTPILFVAPQGVSATNVRALSVVTYLSADSSTVYYGNNSITLTNYGINPSAVVDYSTNSYGFLIQDNTGAVYSLASGSGNCGGGWGRIRSVGQFGPAYSADNVSIGQKYLIDSGTTSAITTSVATQVNRPITVQVAQITSACFATSELSFAWDLTGSGNYSTPDTLTLSQTGYMSLNANLNYNTTGRKSIALQVTTPDGLNFTFPFTIGVDPAVSTPSPSDTTTVVDFGDTSTSIISSSGGGAIAIATDGKLYTWGNNYYGQLASPISLYSYRGLALPVALPGGAKPLTVFNGSNASVVVDTNGHAWGVGYSYYFGGPCCTSYDTFTAITALNALNVHEVQFFSNYGLVLTNTGQLYTWQNGGAPVRVTSFSGIQIKSFSLQANSSDTYRLNAVDVAGNLWTATRTSAATQVSAFSGVTNFAWGSAVVAVTSAHEVWYSVDGNTDFGKVAGPAGVTPVDAMFNGNSLILEDSTGQLWTAYPSQSGSLVVMSTWSKYTQQTLGQANASDTPVLQHRGSSFISFKSGNLMNSADSYGNSYATGRCSVPYSTDARVFSIGEFGSYLLQDNITATGYIAISAQGATNFTSGQFFSANSGDSVILRIANPSSSCFYGSRQLTAMADLDGSGNFATSVPLSNDGNGNYSFAVNTVAPNSGRRTYQIKVITPLGTSQIFSVGVGVFGTTDISAVVARSTPINTTSNSVIAVGSDGFAYGWATPRNPNLGTGNQGMAFQRVITSTPAFNPGSPTKVQLPGNVKVREAIPLTSCCNRLGQSYGVIAVDVTGKTWGWANDPNMIGLGFPTGQTPSTPTQIPGLIGVKVVRLSVSSGGDHVLALASTGVVYGWNRYMAYLNDNSPPAPVPGLAGLNIVDVLAEPNAEFAVTDTGDVYSWNGYTEALGRAAGVDYWNFDANVAKVNLPGAVTNIMNVGSQSLTAAKLSNGAMYMWGTFGDPGYSTTIIVNPTLVSLPGGRVAKSAGLMAWDKQSSIVVVATDGTWWDQVVNNQSQVIYVERTDAPSAIKSTVAGFAGGDGYAFASSDGSLYTTNTSIAGTCGVVNSYARVMSDGQFGSTFHDDQIFISLNGSDITRPNTPTTVGVTAWSSCYGGAGLTFQADLTNSGTFGSVVPGIVSPDSSTATANFTFIKSTNGPVYMNFKATTSAGVSGTTQFYTKVVPAPLPGRQIGISINNGDRYTNSSNVNLSLVWPDGTTKIYVSNDGGFAPGTVQAFDLQYTIPWVLPPQASVPLPSIVYARFDNDPVTYYFDDIILDSVQPVLTYAGAAAPSAPSTPNQNATTVSIATDFPLGTDQGTFGTLSTNAVKTYLQMFGFSAGNKNIQLTSLGEENNVGNYDPSVCQLNAAAHVASSEVGVIGAPYSGCALAEIPTLDSSANSPVTLISGTATRPNLTHATASTAATTYPAGVRNFARTASSFDYEGAVAAQMVVKMFGSKAIGIVLTDSPGAADEVAVLQTYLKTYNIPVADFETVSASTTDYRAVMAKFKAAAADTLVFFGLPNDGGVQLFKDKVAILGSNEAVPVITDSSFQAYPALAALSQAQGMYNISEELSVPELLKNSQNGLLQKFIYVYQQLYGVDLSTNTFDNTMAIYHVAALQVLLNAIANSDGTRKGVHDAIFSNGGTSVSADVSILGQAFSINPNTGDISPSTFNITTLTNGAFADYMPWYLYL